MDYMSAAGLSNDEQMEQLKKAMMHVEKNFRLKYGPDAKCKIELRKVPGVGLQITAKLVDDDTTK
jgi:hypothetical protein